MTVTDGCVNHGFITKLVRKILWRDLVFIRHRYMKIYILSF